MPEEQLDREVLERVAVDRRSFVKRVVLGTGFAVPIIASFNMDSLFMDSASAGRPNQTLSPPFGASSTPGGGAGGAGGSGPSGAV